MQVRGGCCFKFQEVFITVTVTAQPFLCHRSLRYLPTLQWQAVQTGYFGTLPEELPPTLEAAVPTYTQCLCLPDEMKPTSFVRDHHGQARQGLRSFSSGTTGPVQPLEEEQELKTSAEEKNGQALSLPCLKYAKKGRAYTGMEGLLVEVQTA